jgi:hypothetical protein
MMYFFIPFLALCLFFCIFVVYFLPPDDENGYRK